MKRVLFVLAVSTLLVGCGDARLKSWRVDPLTKIFPDDTKDSSQSGDAVPLMARNGHASIQIAVRSEAGLEDLSAKVDAQNPLVAEVRHVGYVPVASNPPDTPEDELARVAPALYPDPLLEEFPYKLKAKRTEAIWVTLYAPATTQPGEYTGKVTLTAGGSEIATQPFKVKVTQATVPATQKLQVTNWFTLEQDGLARHFKAAKETEGYWNVLANIGKVMADHRQNVLLTPVLALADPKVEGGAIRYSFAGLDRWVDTFQKAGLIGTIEGGHLLSRFSGYNTGMMVPGYAVEGGKVVKKQFGTDDPRAEQFLNSFLGALYAHLKEKGWEKRYIQHIHDEPHGAETGVYNRYAKIIRKNLPGVPTIDAVGLDQDLTFFADVSDIWVPVLGSFDKQMDKINDHVAKGGHAWFYTCIAPQGRYMNRFIDLPLVKTQLLHWFDFRYNFTGFLHWGGNYWGPKPFLDVQPVINDNETLLPAGDNAIVYPNAEKNTIYSSIRLEAMREGIEDYELLSELAKRDPEKAKKLAATAIPNFTDYVRSVAKFREIQHELFAQ